MPRPFRIVVLPNLDAIIRGYSIIRKKKNQFFVGSDLNNLIECPKDQIEYVKKVWNE